MAEVHEQLSRELRGRGNRERGWPLPPPAPVIPMPLLATGSVNVGMVDPVEIGERIQERLEARNAELERRIFGQVMTQQGWIARGEVRRMQMGR